MDGPMLCRGCCTKECTRNLSVDYINEGIIENYRKMLVETFGILITDLDQDKVGICKSCIGRLQEAYSFKQQVIYNENVFLEKIKELAKLQTQTLKQEIYLFDCKDDYHNFDAVKEPEMEVKINGEMEDDGTTFKTEPLYYTKALQNTGKRKTQINVSNYVESIANIDDLYNSISVGRKETNNQRTGRKSRRSKAEKLTKQITERDSTLNTKPKYRAQNIRDNTVKLISNSNMLIFVSKRVKFGCHTCSEEFLNIKQLREHSELHNDKKHKQIIRCRGKSLIKVDISNLTCNLCTEPCYHLTHLQEHLTQKHNLTFTSKENYLVPYRLEDGFNCVNCTESFNSFTRLAIHMNSHSTNNVCEICGISYVNRHSLRAHLYSLHAEKKCTKCSAVFKTTSTRSAHMRKVHNIGRSIRYCLKCDMTFQYTYMLDEHMIVKHGAQRTIVHCDYCGKKFNTSNNLNVHIRAVHIGEKRFPCSFCEMRFFTSADKARHERTHGDSRPFVCYYCEGTFRSKDSIRRHIRKLHVNILVPLKSSKPAQI